MAARRASPAPVFAALGDPRRMALIARLCRDGPLSVSALAHGAPITRQAISKHLRVLAAAGLAHATRAGRETVWTLDGRPLTRARDELDQIARRWDAALARLRAFVEDGD